MPLCRIPFLDNTNTFDRNVTFFYRLKCSSANQTSVLVIRHKTKRFNGSSNVSLIGSYRFTVRISDPVVLRVPFLDHHQLFTLLGADEAAATRRIRAESANAIEIPHRSDDIGAQPSQLGVHYRAANCHGVRPELREAAALFGDHRSTHNGMPVGYHLTGFGRCVP